MKLPSPICHLPSATWPTTVLIALCLGLFTTGCLTRPALKVQSFAFTIPESSATNTVAQGPVLAIRTLTIASPFDGRAFVYRTGDFSYVRDPYAEFISPPAQLLAPQIGQLLVQTGHFSALVRPDGAVHPDQLAEISISQLYGDFRDHAHPRAVLTLQFTLLSAIHGMPDKVILQKTYTRTTDLNSASPTALIHAWNEDLTEITTEISTDTK